MVAALLIFFLFCVSVFFSCSSCSISSKPISNGSDSIILLAPRLFLAFNFNYAFSRGKSGLGSLLSDTCFDCLLNLLFS
jgi:hypothetical protein